MTHPLDSATSPRAFPLTCRGCGVRARALVSFDPDVDRIDLHSDFERLCRAEPRPAEAWLCPEFRSAVEDLERFLELSCRPKEAA